MGDLLALAALVLFSINAFVVRAASGRLEQGLGFLVALGANVVVAATVVGVQVAVAGGLPSPSSEAVGLFLLAGILSTYLGRRGYFRSVQTMGPSRAAAVQVTNPMFAYLFAWLLLGQRLGPLDVAAMTLVVVGLWLTSRVPTLSSARVRTGGTTRLPTTVLLPAVVAAVCYALGNVARGGAVQQWDEPLVGGLLGAVSGTGAYLLLHVRVRKLAAEIRAADRRGLVLWSVAGTITIAGQMAVIAATAYIPIAVAVAISSALPIFVIPGTVLFLRNADNVTSRTVAGALLVVGGVTGLVLL